MSSRVSILHFVVFVAILLATLFILGWNASRSDMTTATVYLLAYGFLVPLLWAISFFTIRLLLPFFERRQLKWAAFLAPSLILVASILAMRKDSDEIIWAMVIAATIVNIVFYFIHIKKEATI